jgi:RNA polymerase-binding transcription factor DksA
MPLKPAIRAARLRLHQKPARHSDPVPFAAPKPEEGPAAPPRLNSQELEYFRILLLRKKAELRGDVESLRSEALRQTRADAAGDLSMMPIHMADLGTDAYEQEFTLGLMGNVQEILAEIDAALARIDEGAYGICAGTGKPISKSRLQAMPWARYCVTHEREVEERRRRE